MNTAKWTIGLAVIAMGASPVLAHTAIQTAFNYELADCCEPACGCAEPSCGLGDGACCEPSCGLGNGACCEPSCGCMDPCCADGCGCGSACGGGGLSCCLCDCDLGEPCTLSSYICGCDPWFDLGGWTQLGYHNRQTPLSTTFDDHLAFNDVPGKIRWQQQWLWLERDADGSNGMDFGFRFDMMYGTDSYKTQAFGNNPGAWDFENGLDHGIYGWAVPQLYGEVAMGDLSIIGGHFFTLVGYEVVTAPDNFFYSHALTMFNSEPFTHTGVLATYEGLDAVTLYGGWTAGWDTGFEQVDGGSNWLGGFGTNITDGLAFTYISTAGNLGKRSGGGSGYTHSLVLDATLTDDLNYVLQSDLVSYDDQTGSGLADDQVGVNQYLFYTLSDCWAVGTRMEWWKSDGQSFYECTWGANYRPHANVVLRPEIRYDWTPSSAGYTGMGGRDNETTFGVDAIFTF